MALTPQIESSGSRLARRAGRLPPQPDDHNITLTLVGDFASGRFEYQNLGSTTFHGVEGEGKYYVTSDVFVMGSALYQRNEDAAGRRNVTPVANVGLDARFGKR